MSNDCTSHHHACDCREHNIRQLAQATRAAIMELDWIKNEFPIVPHKLTELQALIERAHMAVDVVEFRPGEITGEHTARMACCSDEDDIEQARRMN